ncbi:MAG: type I methionyl aminopeptidase [Candidatus Levybacteria bacterium RIFCSPLOWO2_01_FULL_39_24]|nr:MAG: type I methionyl aminopeptidase [Candidatus Levybacteria bacterium RIFCSPHIGHO2_01_FULL_40_16]OGH28566.1 MAG: type I methionyl aminopeptidase [Candidatus Levybacteria bacterium RIFCSPHIGHO2_12_FULL_39_9]OGH45955.1 MAG: type I methionyl aminopeptidase [Candidatus Levybacteria bacterium RIFCSPLOWO2_01_FULL_39_24]
MINLKTKEEIEIMRAGGKILADVLFEVLKHVRVGVSELELDQLAEKLILNKGGEPGFKKVEGYKHTICISTNDVVVHGIPTEYKLKEGDVIGIDCGVYYKGFHTDMAQTLRVSTQNSKLKTQNYNKIDKFLQAGEKAMWKGIKAAKPGNRIGDISKAIQGVVEGQGYAVVRSLIGHGVGKELHEDPEVPGFLDDPALETPLLKEGMTIAIEAIYNMGKSDVVYSGNDGWTIKSKDGSLSGLFERTIAITRQEPIILTK